MKKLFFAIVAVASMSFSTVNAQESKSNDEAILRLLEYNYTDAYTYSEGTSPEEKKARILGKHGAYIGIGGGVKNFDGRTVPYGEVVLGWEGGPKMPVKFEYNGILSQGHYTREADRTNDYVEFDSHLIAAVCLGTTHNKQWRFWLGAYGSYKLSFDYHENENTTTTIRETESEIIKTTETLTDNIEVKASSLGFGAYAEVGYTPWMSRISYRLYGGFGRQQRFYDDGNRWHNEAFGGVKIVYNFSVANVWDKAFLKKNGLTKSDVKKFSKVRRTVELY
jgi:hypothetical protein